MPHRALATKVGVLRESLLLKGLGERQRILPSPPGKLHNPALRCPPSRQQRVGNPQSHRWKAVAK